MELNPNIAFLNDKTIIIESEDIISEPEENWAIAKAIGLYLCGRKEYVISKNRFLNCYTEWFSEVFAFFLCIPPRKALNYLISYTNYFGYENNEEDTRAVNLARTFNYPVYNTFQNWHLMEQLLFGCSFKDVINEEPAIPLKRELKKWKDECKFLIRLYK